MDIDRHRYLDLATYGAQTIAKGSKSFALASLFFNKDMQADAQMLYAWCRYCDDVIDGQDLGGDAPDESVCEQEHQQRLAFLRDGTSRALLGDLSGIPAFDAFGAVARKVSMPPIYPDHLLDGFQMDVDRRSYATLDELMQYCYGVAGVVGIMMAIVMGVDRDDHATLDRACDLGLAFQLTNICRDVMDDARGARVYLPIDLLRREGIEPHREEILKPQNAAAIHKVSLRLLHEADRYYLSASQGIRVLSARAAAAVTAARDIYREIGQVLITHGPDAWNGRVNVSKNRKLFLALKALMSGPIHATLNRSVEVPQRTGLWQRPFPS